jgi:two-component system NtrC family sensor kinase
MPVLSSTRRGSVALAVICAVAIEALIAWVVWQGRREQITDGFEKAQQLARLLAEQTSDAFRTADLVLLGIKDTLERGPLLPENDPQLGERMRARLTELPHVRAFFVVGADGFITHDTNYPATPRMNVADRDYFKEHEKNAVRGSYVGMPLWSRRVDGWFVPISRRMEREKQFSGVVVAALEPKFFADFYRALGLRPRDAVALLNTDTTLVARFPELPSFIGRPWPQLNLFKERLPSAPTGSFSTNDHQSDRAIISYRSLHPLPLVTTVVLNESDLLAGWRRSAFAWAVAAVLAPLFLALFVIILERHRSEREAALKRATKTQKLEALGRMTAGIAHDFNNILTVVASSLRLVRRHGANEEYIAAGEQALEQGARLSAQLSGFAMGQELCPILANVNELLESLQPIIRQAVGPGVRTHYKLDPGILPCVVDRAQFDSAILNLVVNASQAMRAGGDITISAEQTTVQRRRAHGLKPGSYVAVRVEDSGCGIPEAELRRVFEPYFTTKEDTGTGLGLPQVQALMHAIGGDARIESVVDSGTTVELLFPCRMHWIKREDQARMPKRPMSEMHQRQRTASGI